MTEPRSPSDCDDPRLAFIYREAVRGLVHQQGVVESLNARAGNLTFAAAFTTSLLGTRALSDGLGIWDWVAVMLLFAVGGLVAFMLWPHHDYRFRFDPEELLARYVDGDRPTTMSEMHRALAVRIDQDLRDNWRTVQRIRIALEVALVLLLLQIMAWLLSIARI
jgi:hypothetical protein